MSRAIMIQGTGSNVGKSLLVAGLCRALYRRGVSVAPFKPQNMSNNAAVTVDGGEIGRAQALQARAAGLEAHTDMNPVLLKPESEIGVQVVVHGRRLKTVGAKEYTALKPQLMAPVLKSFHRLKSAYDFVIVEGAGSPAEVNLRDGDIANMGFARAAAVPVVLCGDIDRGGVIAQILGTQAVLDPADAALVRGFIINKFRGDTRLFDEGYRLIETRSGWAGLGVVPWFFDAWKLPAEDAQDIHARPVREGTKGQGTAAPRRHIVCLRLPRIANFDDLDPLKQEPGVRLTMLEAGQALPGDTDVVIVPGSKSTRADLAFVRAQGWDIDLRAHHRRGGRILGICGGYQMLGRRIHDPLGIEGPVGEEAGLGLLDINTVMGGDKNLTRVHGAVHIASQTALNGYEIHIGQSHGPDCQRPFARLPAILGGRDDGASSPDGRVSGSYLHGMFDNDAFRAAWLADLGVQAQDHAYHASVEAALDALCDHIEAHLDLKRLTGLMAP